jgi:hypothetical protein
MLRLTTPIGTLALLLLLGGCATYVDGYNYMPRPAVANIAPTPPQTVPPVTAFASVIGVHLPDSHQGIPLSVQVQLRIENNGPETVVFDPQSMQMLDGELLNFPPPLVWPAGSVTLAPQQAMAVSAMFPFAPGRSYDNTDLNALQLRWAVQLNGRNQGQAVSFTRIAPAYYYYQPYWAYPAPYPWFGFGGVIVIHRR